MISPIQHLVQSFDPSIYLSLALLFGIAAQFRAMDGHSFLTRMLHALQTRLGILFAVVVVTSLFSPLILNDVLVLVLTPVLIGYSKRTRVDIAPLVVAEITFTNIASSLTPLGNPQNILLWQATDITATDFLLGTWAPLLLSGLLAAVMLYPLSRVRNGVSKAGTPNGSVFPGVYLLLVALTTFTSNLFGISNVLALGICFLLGFFFTWRKVLLLADEFDVRSLLTLYLLVAAVTVVSAFIAPAAAPYASEAASGVQPFSALFVGILSAVISNVPTTQLLLSLTVVSSHLAPKIAVEAGLAGNIDPVASFANILALVMIRRAGLPIRRAILLQFVVGIVAFLPSFL